MTIRIEKSMPRMNEDDVIEMMARSNAEPSEMGLPSPSTEEAHNFEVKEETRRKPIVSINGQDIDEDELHRRAA